MFGGRFSGLRSDVQLQAAFGCVPSVEVLSPNAIEFLLALVSAKQLVVPVSEGPMKLPDKSVMLVADNGTSGHYNGAIDAGETVTVNIALENVSDTPFRSTSGFLESEDELVRIDANEVVYTEKKIIDGETVTFAPGSTIRPGSNFTFTVSPLCPDGREIVFGLLVWDSDQGKSTVPFSLKVFNVGPSTSARAGSTMTCRARRTGMTTRSWSRTRSSSTSLPSRTRAMSG